MSDYAIEKWDAPEGWTDARPFAVMWKGEMIAQFRTMNAAIEFVKAEEA